MFESRSDTNISHYYGYHSILSGLLLLFWEEGEDLKVSLCDDVTFKASLMLPLSFWGWGGGAKSVVSLRNYAMKFIMK